MSPWNDGAARSREWASQNPLRATIQRSIISGLLAFAIFHDWRAGLIGLACTLPFGWYWWRPGGPGPKRVERDR
jgi:hypothetical protein